MRHIPILALLILSCAPPVQSFTGASPAPVGDAVTCVVRELGALSYTVQNVDRASGFVRAEKQDDGAWLAGQTYYTEMNVTVLPANGGSEVRVTATRTTDRGGSRSSTGLVMTDAAKADAAALMDACAQAAPG